MSEIAIPELVQLREVVRRSNKNRLEASRITDELVVSTAQLLRAVHAKRSPLEDFHEWLQGKRLRAVLEDGNDIERCVRAHKIAKPFGRRLQEILNEGAPMAKVFVYCWTDAVHEMDLRIEF